MSLIDVFDCVMILNLPHRSDRRIQMRDELARVGWNPDDSRIVWFPAIDTKTAAGFPSPGSRGCFLSHIGALNLARNSGYARILVLEDDCDFDADFARRQAPLAGWLRSNSWGIAYLGHIESVSGPAEMVSWPRERGVALTHCYAISGDAASRLASYLEAITMRPAGSSLGGPMSIDAGFNWFRRDNPDVVTVLASPSAAHQRSSRSDLTPKWFDTIPILSSAVGAMRSARWRTSHLRSP